MRVSHVLAAVATFALATSAVAQTTTPPCALPSTS